MVVGLDLGMRMRIGIAISSGKCITPRASYGAQDKRFENKVSTPSVVAKKYCGQHVRLWAESRLYTLRIPGASEASTRLRACSSGSAGQSSYASYDSHGCTKLRVHHRLAHCTVCRPRSRQDSSGGLHGSGNKQSVNGMLLIFTTLCACLPNEGRWTAPGTRPFSRSTIHQATIPALMTAAPMQPLHQWCIAKRCHIP